ncbi:hypothetical protein S83_007724 [Arachis hypogaea]|nr:Cation-chloride cotransporter [Arachis hypogaea]
MMIFYLFCATLKLQMAVTLFTAILCGVCVIIGNLDLITPTITMFFLLCYTGVNLSCFLLDLLDAPSWQPRWKFHHWFLSLVGALLCIVIMFLISWSFTVVALALASLIYKYVGLKGKAGVWGDGFKSAYFQLALRSLRSLGENQVPQDESQDAFKGAQQRIDDYLNKMKAAAKKDGTPLMANGKRAVVNEQQVEKFLFTTLKLNSIMLRYSRMAAVVLVSLPPPPLNHPSYFYMEYMDMLLENIPRILIVRGYLRDVVTLFT